MAGPGKWNVVKTPDWRATTDKRRLRIMKISDSGMGNHVLRGLFLDRKINAVVEIW